MTRVQHFDRVDVRFDRSTLRTNADGTMTVDGVGAHVGNYTYHDDKGRPFVEHVPAETLFSQPSLDSAAGTPVTIRHGPGLVTPDSFRSESHGSWVKAWDAGNGDLGVRLRLGSREAIKFIGDAMDAGDPVELSPTYEVDVIDTPGTTDEGQHHAVQDGRVYSAIAILGPDEARGGPGTRLQLDGPVCAPKGSRVQVRRAQLDSAANPRISFVAKDRDSMKQAIISSGGKSCTIGGHMLAGLRLMHVDAKNADQIETTEVTWQSGDEEPGMMVIPTQMWEGMLEGIGASGAPVAADLPAAELEVEQVEGLDADDDEKLDSKVSALVARELRKRDARDAKTSSRRTSVNADAARILPPGYDYSASWHAVALDAIAKADPELEARAKGLAKLAFQGDAVAEGRLRELLAGLASKTQDSTGGLTLVNIGNKPGGEGLANPIPPHERQKKAGGDA